MKKYKIGNRIITCDSPVKAAKIVKQLDSVKDGYKTNPNNLKSGQKIIENGRVVTILSITGNAGSGYHAKVQHEDGSIDKWYFMPHETITVVDSVKDSAINVKKVHNASEKYVVLEEDRPDGKEFYWVVGKNKYHGEKQYMGGGTLEFHLDEAIRVAKDYTIMEHLNEKYGEKEGYKRWMRGETDSVKDEEIVRTPRGTFKLSNKPYRQLKEEGWGFWFDYADLYYDGKGPWYKIMHDPRTQSTVAAIYKSISDSVKDQMSVIVTNREDAEQELRDRNVQYDTIKLAAGTDDLHYFNGDKKVAIYSKVREKLYLMDSIKDSKVKDEDNFGYAIRNGKVYILLNGKVHQTFPNEDAAKDAGWNLDSMTQYN